MKRYFYSFSHTFTHKRGKFLNWIGLYKYLMFIIAFFLPFCYFKTALFTTLKNKLSGRSRRAAKTIFELTG